jgi:hypothetical protein
MAAALPVLLIKTLFIRLRSIVKVGDGVGELNEFGRCWL